MNGSKLVKSLKNVGYEIIENETLEQQVINCFLDMVDGGVYANLDYTEAKEEIESGEITLEQMCNSLMRM